MATSTTTQVSASPGAPITGEPSPGHPKRWLILAVLAAVAFMAQLDLFIVNVAVPAMSRSFTDIRLTDMSWVLNAYAIVFAALLVPAGRFADHFGRRRFLLIGVAIFTAGSVLCAVAPTFGLLVTGRVVQAIGAALIVPTSLGLLLPVFSKAQHALVVGIWAGVAAVAASAGPPVGGVLIGLSWRWIFLINVPIGLLTIIGGIRLLPEVRAGAGARLPNPLSVVSVLVAITLLVLATVEGSQWGWGSAATIGLYVAAAIATGITVQKTIRHPHAMIEASLFRSRDFTAASIALFLFFVAFSAFLLITVLFLQDVWHYSAARTGLAIVPGPMTSAVFAVNSGRIRARFGRVMPAVLGPLLFALAGGYWLLAVPPHPSYVTGILPGLIVAGAGAGITQAPLFAAAGTLAPDRATTGSAVLNMSRQVGSAVGVAVLVALLASPQAGSLSVFHRGWTLQILAALGATASVLVVRERRPSVQAV